MSRPAALPPAPPAAWLEQLTVTELPNWVLHDRRLSDRAVRLYGQLAAYGAQCTAVGGRPDRPAPSELARWLGCPPAAAQRALTELLLAGVLEVLDDAGSYRLGP